MPFQSINPHNGELFNQYQFISDKQLAGNLGLAKGAYVKLQSVSFSERTQALQKLAQDLKANAHDFAVLMAKEMGKPLAQGRAEAEKCAWLCEYYAACGPEFLQERHVQVDDSIDARLQHKPLGILLGIMPWNFPFWQVFRCAIPAIMAGNVFILKHAPNVGGCALALEKLFLESGLPENTFTNFFADLEQTNQLIQQVAAVSLTGSTRAGRAVAAEAGKALKKVVLELGGSDPFIVLADADIDLAVKTGIASRLLNSGQSCIAAKRFIVAEKIYDEFCQKLQASLEQNQVGDPLNEENQVGPLARLDLQKQAQSQLKASLDQGAKIVFQADAPSGGYYFPPVLLSNVSEDMACWAQETFAPIFVLQKCKQEKEMIAMANRSEYGLGAAIFSQDTERALQIGSQIESGSLFINEMVKSDPRLPFGGIKDSGFGRELADSGIHEFTNLQTVYVNRLTSRQRQVSL